VLEKATGLIGFIPILSLQTRPCQQRRLLVEFLVVGISAWWTVLIGVMAPACDCLEIFA